MILPNLVMWSLNARLQSDNVRKFAEAFEGLPIDRLQQLDFCFEAVAQSKNKVASYLFQRLDLSAHEKSLIAHHAITHNNQPALLMSISALDCRDEHFLALQLAIDFNRSKIFTNLFKHFSLSVEDRQKLVIHAWEKEMQRFKNMDVVARLSQRSSKSFSNILSATLSDQELISTVKLLDLEKQNGHDVCMHAAFMLEHHRPAVHDHMFTTGVRMMQQACAQIVHRSHKR